MSRKYRRKDDDSAMSLIVMLLLAFYALPLVGLYFLLRKDPSKRGLGIVLLAIGLILWIVGGAGS